MQVERYIHHGNDVAVLSHVKGKHREHCLCYAGCIHFRPGKPDHCPIAAENYALCQKHGLVTPVFECPKFEAAAADAGVKAAYQQRTDRASDEDALAQPPQH